MERVATKEEALSFFNFVKKHRLKIKWNGNPSYEHIINLILIKSGLRNAYSIHCYNSIYHLWDNEWELQGFVIQGHGIVYIKDWLNIHNIIKIKPAYENEADYYRWLSER